jgi:hypothetical protein
MMVSESNVDTKALWTSEMVSSKPSGHESVIIFSGFNVALNSEPIELWGSGHRYFGLTEYENAQLRTENYVLREQIRAIEERLASIEASISKDRIVVLREITRDAAKAEIARLFSEGRTLYYSDIARELQLDLELVVDLCNELINEGEISIADSA